jgi:dUTP pyrophosphatase
VRVLLLNTDRSEPFLIESGDRIAQLVITPFVEASPVEVAELERTARGEGGFGSSGG